MVVRRKRRKPVHVAVIRNSNGKRRITQNAVRKKDGPLHPKEQRQLLQLVVCSSIFVMIVAVKLLMPSHVGQIHQVLSGAMERNVDVEAVFSAIGGALSGEKEAGDTVKEVYQAVLKPQDIPQTMETEARIPRGDEAIETLRQYRRFESAIREETPVEQTEAVQVASLAYILYSDENLPEGVSMEQEILGFSYSVPVVGEVSSDFGYREHPVEGEERFHYGIDFAAYTGAEILSFADGVVTVVGESSSYGKYCIVRHSDDYSTLYAHCSRITVSSGASVTEGQKIAEVGETGIATGPHLHFELQRNGTYLNPIYYVSTV